VKTRTISAVLSLAVCSAVALSAPSTHAGASCDRQPVMQIDSGQVSVEPDGISISAFGTSESAGWSGATLVVAARQGSTATVDFFACRPEMAAQVLTPIQAQATLNLPPDTSRIIIRARTNSMTVDINSK
jgi:hypothetical protein